VKTTFLFGGRGRSFIPAYRAKKPLFTPGFPHYSSISRQKSGARGDFIPE
jgi:hypothetical protein